MFPVFSTVDHVFVVPAFGDYSLGKPRSISYGDVNPFLSPTIKPFFYILLYIVPLFDTSSSHLRR